MNNFKISKKTYNAICGISLIALFFGCNKQEYSSFPIEKKVIEKDLNYKVVDGIIEFASSEAYFHLQDSLMKLSDDNYINWTEEHKISTLRKIQDSLIIKLSNVCSEDEFYEIILNNSNYLIYSNIDSTVNLKVDNNLFKNIANKDGYFKVGKMFHFIESDNLKCTKANNLKSAIENFTNNKNIIVENLSKIRQEAQLKATNVVCGSSYFDSEDHDGDRRVELTMKMDIDFNYSDECYMTYQQYYEIKIVGKKKNLWGNWITYETILSHDDFEFSYNEEYCNGYTEGYTPYGCWDEVSIKVYGSIKQKLIEANSYNESDGTKVISSYVGHIFQNLPILQSNFIKVRGKAWTRGTTNEDAAEFCCNFIAPCF